MSIQNNSEKVPRHELVVKRRATNSRHLGRQIEELRDRISRIEQEWSREKVSVSLLSKNQTADRLEEQPYDTQSFQNEERFNENSQSLTESAPIESDKVDQHFNQQEVDQSQESGCVMVLENQQRIDETFTTSKFHKCFAPFEKYFQDLLLNRYKKEHDPVLLSARIFFVILAFLAAIIEMAVFCNIRPDSKELKFLFGSTFLLYEIAGMIYASGAAMYGAVFEAWIYLILAIINCILAHCVWKCDDDSHKRASIYWIIKVIALATCTELAHQNFCRLKNYNNAVKKSSRHVLRQAVLFILTILFLVAPGLKAVYQSIYIPSSGCFFEVSCGIVELYEPQFNTSNPCETGFVEYIASREEIRILRNFIYFHIAFYSMFNKPFLEISFSRTYAGLLRFLMLCGFFFLTVSYMWANINPFGFVKVPKRYIFDIVELALALLMFIILSIQCSKWNSKLKTPVKWISWLYCSKANTPETSSVEENSEPMVEYPNILYIVLCDA